MKGKSIQIFYTILGFVLLALIIYALIRVLLGGWTAYKSLSDNVQIAIAAGVLSIAGTLASLIYTKLKEKQLQIEASHAAKKQRLYSQYTKEVFDIITRGEGTEEEWLPVRKRFLENSLLWSDEKVLNAFHQMRIKAQNGAYTSDDFARLIMAFRKDLGLKNKNLNEQIILEIMYDKEDLKKFNS